jgi:thiamine biosynthesis lipoprotein
MAVAFVGALLAWRVSPLTQRLEHQGTVRVQQQLMGTLWNIEVADHGRPVEARHAIDLAYAELRRIDSLMSEWKPESPISQVNAAAGTSPVEVPAELRELIERSIRYSEKTAGTFDITWRGMGKLWHFDDSFVPPAPVEVEKARKRVNYRAIEVKGNRIFLPAHMNIGLGGIAKGYAVDRAVGILAKAGFADALVDGGGDVLVSGTRNGEPWRLGIQDPRGDHGKILGSVPLTNMALVTSGDYERFRIVNGVRYHHIIDPRTGWPANASMSVSVMSKSAEQGVVLAKGIFILGGEKGMALARSEGVEALLIDAQGRRFTTPGFARLE